NLEIHMDRTINPYCALSLFANASLKSLEHSIKLHFDYNETSKLKFNLSNQIFESIFYKSNRVVDFVLCLCNNSSPSIERKEILLRNYPRLRINVLNS
ncbi:26192_t:CDS:1, partial [Racocetra persica]